MKREGEMHLLLIQMIRIPYEDDGSPRGFMRGCSRFSEGILIVSGPGFILLQSKAKLVYQRFSPSRLRLHLR